MASDNRREFLKDWIKQAVLNAGLSNILNRFDPSKAKSYKRPYAFVSISNDGYPEENLENNSMETCITGFSIRCGFETETDIEETGMLSEAGDALLDDIEIALNYNQDNATYKKDNAYELEIESWKTANGLPMDNYGNKGECLIIGEVIYTRTWIRA